MVGPEALSVMALYDLARVSVTLFAVSVIFPIVGGLFVAGPPPRWLGIADVIIAAALFASTVAVVARVRRSVADHESARRAPDQSGSCRRSSSVTRCVLRVGESYPLDRARHWPGVAAWLLLYSVPYLVAALRVRGK